MKLKYDPNGLLPAICQDATSGEILMVAWMNAESLRLTQETGEAHFWTLAGFLKEPELERVKF